MSLTRSLRRIAVLPLLPLLACAAAAPAGGGPAAPARAGAARPEAPAVAAAKAACTSAALADDDLPADEEGFASERSRRAVPRDPLAICVVADANLRRDEDAILSAHAADVSQRAAGPAVRRWDRHAKPAGLDAIARRFALTPAERARVLARGVAVPARLTLPGFTWAFHEVYQSQLPLYVSIDAIFHAIFAAHDGFVAALEKARLAPLLLDVLAGLRCALPAAAGDLPPEVARDLDVYLLVALRLAAGTGEARAVLGDASVDAEAAALVAKATAAASLEEVTIFGRARAVDFTQFTPRGHYAADGLDTYFRAAMWLSRLELNLVSRSSRSSSSSLDARETPREALVALALAGLVQDGGREPALRRLDRAWGMLAGRREDVSPEALVELRARAGIQSLRAPDAFDRLKAAIGDGHRRTVRMHVMAEGATDLPVIATLLGPRAVADAAMLLPLVHGAVPDRHRLGVADVAFALGDEHARAYLADDLARFPQLDGGLAAARRSLGQSPLDGEDLYGAWLAAVRALAEPVAGAVPSSLLGAEGKDLRLNSLAAAFGQLKHNYALMAGQPYAEFGCAIPDAYVEPVPAVYDALIAYATRAGRAAALLDPRDTLGGRRHFAEVARVLRVLRAIVDDELANRPLDAAELRFLGMIAELDVNGDVDITGHPPLYTGWYFDLFYARESDGMRDADFVADYFTSQEGVAYAGATSPRLGVFVVDTGGAPRAFVGPVARAWERFAPLERRLDDAAARALPEEERADPWARSYTVPAPPAPALAVELDEAGDLLLEADAALGPVRVELLDHHRAPLASRTVQVRAGTTRVPFHHRRGVGAVAVHVGGFTGWAVVGPYGDLKSGFGARAAKEE